MVTCIWLVGHVRNALAIPSLVGLRLTQVCCSVSLDTMRWLLHIEAWFRLWRNNLPLHSSYRSLRGSIREEKGVGYGVYLSVAGGDFA